jgi:hypothetical protein
MKLSKQKKYFLLAGLLIFAFVIRIGYFFDGTIPFSFDHGKDALAIMHLITTKSPALIGPWTSIPGLYFGPAWYYLLAPAFWLGGFNPIVGPAMMTFLVLIQVALAYKYFGKFTALIIACAPFWVMISVSAWNPFPMTLITLVILILLKLARKDGVLSPKNAFLLGLTASFGFHFSAAFAIFYPFIILACLLITKVKIPLKTIFLAGLGFLLPFLPQLAFEVRHDFVQSKAVMMYFQDGESSDAISVKKVQEVLTASLGELKNSVMPEFRILSGRTNMVIQALLVAILAWLWFKMLRSGNAKIIQHTKYFLTFFVIPIVGLFFLHFNLWYVYAITPALAILVGSLLDSAPKQIKWLFACLLILTPLVSYVFYFGGNKAELTASRGFLPIKIIAIKEIRAIAGERPFSSYHYVPDIYDFSYQYLYLMQGFQNKKMPVEFSYKPDAPVYITQKVEIMEKLPDTVKTTTKPEVIFFIVEEPENSEFLESWWQQQQFGEIISVKQISPTVWLYEASPK